MAEKIKLGSNGNFGVKEGGTLAYNDENGVFKAIELESSRSSGATYVNQSGLIADAEVGVPRIDWTNGVGELLLEPASTNYVTYSEDFTRGVWAKNDTTIISSAVLAPDGTNSATTIESTGANDALQFVHTGTALVDYTGSFWLKSTNGSNITAIIRVGDVANNLVVNLTSEWQRFSYTAQGTTTSIRIAIVLQGLVGKQVDVWGAQLEQLSYPTSYIRTNGTTESRIADAVTGNSSLGQVINSSEGVLYAEMSALANDGTFRFISLNDGSSNNALQIYWRTTANQVVVVVRQGGAEVMNESHILSNILDSNKYAIKYKNNDYALWINGVEVWTNTSTTTFSSNTLTDLCLESGAGTSFYRGRIKELKVYDTALTDAELQTLTTL